jgi:predicted MFS family arabinose efflux permease
VTASRDRAGLQPGEARPEIGFRKQLLIIFVARTAINTAHRIVYAFLPSLAHGLGISLQAASGLVALRVVAALAAPFVGPAADRYGRRQIMEVGLLLFALASLFLGVIGTVAAAAMAFVLYGLAKVLYDPAVHAYIGDRVPYARRGRAVGIIELAWSAAWLLGVPASGFLIERLGWRAPWAFLMVAGLFGLWLTHVGLPSVRSAPAQSFQGSTLSAVVGAWQRLLRQRAVLALLATSLLLTLSNEIPFIVYGAWLGTTFGLSFSSLGLASIVVGLAEATAETGTAVITDRLGKQRSVITGLLGTTVALLALPWLAGQGLAPALTGVALLMLTFEFAIVSLLPLVTELAPQDRASLLSLNILAMSLGRILGTLLGGWLWQWERIALHAGVGALCALTAALLISRGMQDPGARTALPGDSG